VRSPGDSLVEVSELRLGAGDKNPVSGRDHEAVVEGGDELVVVLDGEELRARQLLAPDVADGSVAEREPGGSRRPNPEMM
jgi:hypothetical protein